MALKKVNRHVYEEAESKPELKGMGTTLVAAIFTENTTYILNVGDSRCYYFSKNDSLVQVSEDHSLVNDLIRIEGMEQEKAEAVGRHIITRAVGIWPVVEGDIYELNDEFKYLMLSSDGLHDYVDDEKMIDILMDNRSTGKKLEELVDAANGAGGYDNITVILVEE
ncbi:MAG: serine/threonine-protein phosphatase, partial [Erysipelotrichaceae bacterium]|nr:serine/threonine-protein phosphatase [Erysipelotrichaceae bacterium]